MTTYVLDANLIVLLVVGSFDASLVSDRRHKRCREFDLQDFFVLDDLMRSADSVICTPHALAEASNLVRLIGEPLKSALTAHLGSLIPSFSEHYARSAEAVDDADFVRLGLTDASMLSVAADRELLTTDLDLFVAAQRRGHRATNFAHLRDGIRQ